MKLKISLALLLAACLASGVRAADPINVRSTGATGDGTTKETVAFQKALTACADAGGGDVLVPAGKYLIGSVVMKSKTTLHLDSGAMIQGSPDAADYPIVWSRFEGHWVPGHQGIINADHAEHIAIVGAGSISGPTGLARHRAPAVGAAATRGSAMQTLGFDPFQPDLVSMVSKPLVGYTGQARAPVLFEPVNCRDVLMDGISTHYAGMWSIHLLFCDGFVARNVTVRSTGSNGDGFDVDSGRDVHIEHCDIDTGDDCVAVKSGRGMDAVRIARPTQDLYVTDCKLGSGFAGVGVGTELTAGVLDLFIHHCTFTHGANAIYLKSSTERGGFITNVSGDDLDCTAPKNFLGIDLLDKGIADAIGVPGNQGLTLCSNVSFDNVRVNGTGYVLNATYTSPERPVDHLTLTHITGTCQHGIVLANARNVTLGDIKLTGFAAPLLSTDNVTGSGLDGAVPIAPPRPPKP